MARITAHLNAGVILVVNPPPHPLAPFFPSLISIMVSVDVKHHAYLLTVRRTSNDKLYKECGFCTLKQRRKRHKLLMFHKMINYQCPGYLSNLVPPLFSTTNPYHRRRPYERIIPAYKMELYANLFILSTAQL